MEGLSFYTIISLTGHWLTCLYQDDSRRFYGSLTWLNFFTVNKIRQRRFWVLTCGLSQFRSSIESLVCLEIDKFVERFMLWEIKRFFVKASILILQKREPLIEIIFLAFIILLKHESLTFQSRVKKLSMGITMNHILPEYT